MNSKKYFNHGVSLPGFTPFKKPLSFSLVSYHRPPIAFRSSAMAEFVGSYLRVRDIPGTRYKEWRVHLHASAN